MSHVPLNFFPSPTEKITFLLLLLLIGAIFALLFRAYDYFWAFAASVFWVRTIDNKMDFKFRNFLLVFAAILSIHYLLGNAFVNISLIVSVIFVTISEILTSDRSG